MATGDSYKTAGQYCMIAGGVTFFIMALSSTVIFDVVFACALWKQANQAANQENRNPVGAGIKFAATYMLWNLISKSTNPFVLFLLSPFVSIAAAALAVALDVSFIAWGIAAGWGLGLALVVIGYGLYKFADYLNQDKPRPPAGAAAAMATDDNRGTVHRVMARFGLFEVLPTAVATAMNPQDEIHLVSARADTGNYQGPVARATMIS